MPPAATKADAVTTVREAVAVVTRHRFIESPRSPEDHPYAHLSPTHAENVGSHERIPILNPHRWFEHRWRTSTIPRGDRLRRS